MISVIIPTFNRQHTTINAIKSVLAQNIDMEIIVIDDASTPPFHLPDDLSENAKIKLIRHEKNKGAGGARNTGVQIASQPLVSFLDSDDYLLPGTLEARIDFALQEGVSDENNKGIIGCSWQETDAMEKVVNVRHPMASNSPDDFYAGCWFCPGSAIIANRNFLADSNNQFDENLNRLEDLDLFLRLSQLGARYVPHHMIGVSIAISDSRYPDVVIKACDEMRAKHLSLETKLDEKQQSNLKAYLFYELSRAHITKGEYHRALDYLVKSFIQKPRMSLYPGPGWSSKPDQAL